MIVKNMPVEHSLSTNTKPKY
uniref:Uncharacterized protein n=1 Tax=Rhizophora mucronata TaxID=61149 RepID=A0A2P2P280_RHIMU